MGCTLGAARQAKKEEKAEKAMFDRDKPPDKGEENVLFEQPPVLADDDGTEVIVNGSDTNDSTKLTSTDIEKNNKNQLADDVLVDDSMMGRPVQETTTADTSDPDMIAEQYRAIAELERSVSEEDQREADEAPPPPPPFIPEEQNQKPPTPPPPYQPDEVLPPPPPPPFGTEVDDVSATLPSTASTEHEQPFIGLAIKEKSELVVEEPAYASAEEHEQRNSKELSYEEAAQDVVKEAIEAGMEQAAHERESQAAEPDALADSTAEQAQMLPHDESVDRNAGIEVVDAEQTETVDTIEQLPEFIPREGQAFESKAATEPTDMPFELQQEQLDGEQHAELKEQSAANIAESTAESTAESLAKQIINDVISMSTESGMAGKLEDDQSRLEYRPPTVEEYLANFEQYQKCEAVSTEYQPPTVEEYLANFEQYQKCEAVSTEYQPPTVEEYLANFEQYQKCEAVSTEYQPPTVEEYLANFEQYQKCEAVTTEYQPPSVEEYLANFEQYQKCETISTEYQPPSVEEYLANFKQYQKCESVLTEYRAPSVEEYLANFDQSKKCETALMEYRPLTVVEYTGNANFQQNQVVPTDSQPPTVTAAEQDQTREAVSEDFCCAGEQYSGSLEQSHNNEDSQPHTEPQPFIEKESEL